MARVVEAGLLFALQLNFCSCQMWHKTSQAAYAEARACVLPGWLKLGCLLQPGCAQGLDTTLIMPGSLCVQQNRPRALPGWWKLGCRMQPSNAQCRLVTLTMPWCLCFPARVASLIAGALYR